MDLRGPQIFFKATKAMNLGESECKNAISQSFGTIFQGNEYAWHESHLSAAKDKRVISKKNKTICKIDFDWVLRFYISAHKP